MMVGREANSPEQLEALVPRYLNPEIEGIDKRNQEVFHGLVERIQKSDIGILPDLTSQLDHTGLRAEGIEESLGQFGKTVLLSTQVLEIFSRDSAPDRVAFTSNPMLRLGRENSRRNVFFGSLQGLWESDTASIEVEVAAAPIPKEVITKVKALHEIAMYQYLNELGVPTLDVLGVVLNEDTEEGPYGYLLTKFDPDIMTLDSLDWSKMDEDDARQALEYAVDTLALLHGNCLFHGDTAFKNIAVTDSGQSPVIVDLEFGGSFRDAGSNLMLLTRSISGDFSMLAQSVDMELGRYYRNEKGESNTQDRYKFFCDNVFLPYQERLGKLGIKSDEPIALAFDNVVQRRADEAAGEQGYWRHL